MGKYANFQDGVKKLLDKIADKLDGSSNYPSANYSTSVLNSLERIADNFDPSGGGLPQVWCYNRYLYKTDSDFSASNRYSVEEFKALLDDHTFAWGFYDISDGIGEVPCFVLYYKYSNTVARAAILPYNNDQTKYTTSATNIPLSGTGYARCATYPSIYAIPSSSGGGVLTISENTISMTSVTEVMTAIENGSLIRLDYYGTYYPCLYSVVHQDDTTFVELGCGPYNILIYEDPESNVSNYVGWPSNDAETGEG